MFGDSDTSDTVQAPIGLVSVEPAANESLVVSADKGGLAPWQAPKPAHHPTLSITPVSSINWVDSSDTPIEYFESPRPMYCTGRCHEDFKGFPRADVVRDKQSPRYPYPHPICLDIDISYEAQSNFLGGSSWVFNN